MFPYSLGVTTIVQGLYSLLWIVILMDVLSPTMDLRDLPALSGPHGFLVFTAIFTVTFAVGGVMYTVSRNVFRKKKDLWSMEVLTSASVRDRLDSIGSIRPSGGPSLQEVQDAEGFAQVRTAGEFMHAVDHVMLIRAPHVQQTIQIYRDQYRIARGFILPSLILAVVLPFWELVPRGDMGNFPLIGFQLFFLAIFFAGVSMYTFRERSFRYAAARLRSFLTLETEAQKASQRSDRHLSAIA